jgi:RNA polymerase sigma-70 factor (ECF subfamily)
MIKYKRFIASVRHLRDYRKKDTRPAVEAWTNARRRAGDGIDVDLHSALVALLPRMRRFAMSLAPSTVGAEALVRAAYDRAMSRQARFQTDARLVARMYRIMWNLFLDENIGLEDRRQSGPDAAREVSPAVAGACSEKDMTLAGARRAFADLPEHERTLLILICVDRMSYKEAAAVLDIPVDAIASRMARARQALHEQITGSSSADVADMRLPSMPACAGMSPGEH